MKKKVSKRFIAVTMAVFMILPLFNAATFALEPRTPNLSAEFLETLSDEVILELYAPFLRIIEEVNMEYGVEIFALPIYYAEVRAVIIRNIANNDLVTFRQELEEHAVILQSVNAWNELQEAILDAYYDGAINSQQASHLSNNLGEIGHLYHKLNALKVSLDEGVNIVDLLDKL